MRTRSALFLAAVASLLVACAGPSPRSSAPSFVSLTTTTTSASAPEQDSAGGIDGALLDVTFDYPTVEIFVTPVGTEGSVALRVDVPPMQKVTLFRSPETRSDGLTLDGGADGETFQFDGAPGDGGGPQYRLARSDDPASLTVDANLLAANERNLYAEIESVSGTGRRTQRLTVALHDVVFHVLIDGERTP